MSRSLKDISNEIIVEHQFRRNWKAIVSVLSCFVIATTFFALSLPAMTLSGTLACGMEAHTHSADCYEAVEGSDEPNLTCDKEEHVHSDACYEKADAAKDAEQKESAASGAKKPKRVVKTMEANNANGANDVELDFAQWITNVTLQKKTGHEQYTEITDGKISSSDELRFKVEYTIPGQQLSTSQKTIKYKIPDGLTVANDTSGDVRNSQGQKIGVYQIESDTIRITFDDNTANQNSSGQAVNGYVYFEAKVDASKSDDEGKESVKFSDSVTLDLHFTDKKITTEDLKVQKTATQVDESTGTITYKIEVTSQNGTASAVELSDVMQNVKLYGEVAVEGISDPDVSKTEKGFDIKLPQMSPNGKYVITYTAKLANDMVNGTIQASNKVSVDSTRSDGAKLHDEQDVNTDFKHEILKKENIQISDDGKLHWTIVVNDAKMDISGWTLSDKLNGIPFKETVKISPAVNGQSQITLPYTFPQGSNQTYTITYETDPEKKLGYDQAVNTAILTPKNNGQPFTKDGWGWFDNTGSFNPLDKKADIQDASAETPDDKGNIILPWTLTVDSAMGSIPAGWKLYDELENDQWFTKEQLDVFIGVFKGLNYSLTAWELKPNGEKGEEVSSLTTGVKYKAIELTFTDVLAKGNRYEVKYNSTAPVGFGGSKTFHNRATINDDFEHKPKIIYNNGNSPTVRKYDARAENAGKSTKHEYNNDSKPSWFIDVEIPNNYNGGKLIVDEILPKGVEIEALYIIDGEKQEAVPEESNDDAICYQKDSKHKIVHISIPQAFTVSSTSQARILRFKIDVNIDADNATWNKGTDGMEVASFENSVQLFDKTGKKIDGDSQAQEFSRKTVEPNIAKSAGEVKNNVIPYTLVINPEGKDLVPGSDVLTLEDELKYQAHNGIWQSATLVPGSVNVYKRNSDGSKGDKLGSLDYTQKYTELEDASDPYNPPKCTRKLEMTIPDSQALVISYEYLVHGTLDKYREFSNTATLKGVSDGGSSSGTNTTVHITNSGAGADTEGTNISIYKVDSENYGIGLSGARFELYQWNPNTEQYELKKNEGSSILTTGSDGLIKLPSLAYNTAYKLVEIEAPKGYQLDSTPYYFCVENTDKTKNPDAKPGDFQGDKRYSGDILYRPNTQQAAYELPKTGGSGTMWHYAGGALLATAAGLALCIRRKRLKGGDAA